MTLNISGPGLGLPYPQNLYPSHLYNAPVDSPTNYLSLSPGNSLPIPAGKWLIDLGRYAILQYLDPVTGVWRGFNAGRSGPQYVFSDGFTRRVANLTGCAVAAIVTGGGSAYVSGSTTVSATTGGGSTWTPIVGGQLSVTAVGASVAGSGYGVAPLVFIPPPPAGAGVQATAKATLSVGTVASVTLTNVGAGYTTVPTVTILPNPTDPNFADITNATINGVALVNSGVIAAVLCEDSGAPLASAGQITLTAAGAGSGATISAVVMESVVSAAIPGEGIGWGAVATPPLVTTTGGVPAAVPAYTNPSIELTQFVPRAALIAGTITAAAGSITQVSVVYDGGLFLMTGSTAPTPLIIPGNGAVPTGAASVALTLGGNTDTVLMQPL